MCDCCDPKTRRRGGGSSEDNSEAEINEIPEVSMFLIYHSTATYKLDKLSLMHLHEI